MTAKIPGLPISSDELRALFDYLDRENPEPCTHTFKETAEFLAAKSLPVEPMLNWLGNNGAGCDCEVIFNTDARWGEQVGR